MDKALITGVTGFTGSHLAEYLLKKGIEVHGTIRWRSKTDNIQDIRDQINLVEADMRDAHSMRSVINDVAPDVIFHLAAQSFVPASWRSPADTLEINAIGTVNLFEAVKDSSCEPVIQIAGSSEEYGLVYPEELPISEKNPLRPLSPYGVSKVATDLLGFQYFKNFGLKIIRTRAFNHSGPRRGEVFVDSNFAKQLVEIEKGLKKPILRVGDLSSQRDFTDVRDIVKAYYLAIMKCVPGEVYNICSETSRTIQEVLDTLIELTESSGVKVEADPKRFRPTDVAVLRGDCSKFKKQTGWKPEIPFRKTMEDTLDYWRKQV
jgi:GDP-4-dehydro-6-deoxy-D-mannose reductase